MYVDIARVKILNTFLQYLSRFAKIDCLSKLLFYSQTPAPFFFNFFSRKISRKYISIDIFSTSLINYE